MNPVHLAVHLAVACAAAVLSSNPVGADVLVVPTDYPTIQAAVDTAVDGDVIEIEPGVYFEAVVIEDKSIDVVGVGGADVTTLDAFGLGASVVAIYGDGDDEVALCGVTLRGGAGTQVAGVTAGGGILAQDVTLTLLDMVVRLNSVTGFNSSGLGGGIYQSGGALIATGCLVEDNAAVGSDSGGLHLELAGAAEFVSCTIRGSRAKRRAGGLVAASSIRIVNCLVEDNANTVMNPLGTFVVDAPTVLVQRSVYRDHFGYDDGDGMRFSPGALFEDCEFLDNRSDDHGVVTLNGATFHDCIFHGNDLDEGDGAAVRGSGNTFIGCEFVENDSRCNSGGAVSGSDLTFIECELVSNSAVSAGAVRTGGQSLFLDCRFDRNVSDYNGGAIGQSAGSVAIVIGTSFRGNLTSFDHAETIDGGDLVLLNSRVQGIERYNRISIDVNDAVVANSVFLGSTWLIAGDLRGRAMVATGTAHVANSTFLGERLVFEGRTTVDNSILSKASLPLSAIVTGGPNSDITIASSNVEGGRASIASTGSLTFAADNIDADPLFMNPLGPDGLHATGDEDLRLAPGSPCIDAGNNALVPLDVYDVDGDGDVREPLPFDHLGRPRFVDDPDTPDTGIGSAPLVDMGANEYQVATCSGDANFDSAVNALDVLHVLTHWGSVHGDVTGDGVTNVADLLVVLANWGLCQ